MWRSILVVLACLMPLTLMADDDYYGMMGRGMGYGMMGGGMGGGMMGGGPYHLLNLTDDQRGKINKLRDEERRKHWETMGKIMDEHARLRDLYDADKRDTQAILKVQDQINAHQRKMLELHLNTRNQIEALLTQEQRDQLRSWHRGGWGMGPGMMGPGYGGRGMMGR
jgi:Spy/CpxP family protein refolding chaperone